MKKLVLALIIFFGLSTLSFAQETKDILFVSKTCPHCAKVEGFLEKYQLTDKVEIVDTYENEENTALMDEWFDKLQIDQATRGVPFLVIGGTEYKLGDQLVIDYFVAKYNVDYQPDAYQATTADTVFLFVGGGFLLVVLGYGIYSVVRKK